MRDTHTEKKHANNLYSLLRGKGGNQCSFFFPFAKNHSLQDCFQFLKKSGEVRQWRGESGLDKQIKKKERNAN